jgi:hypothetical protein
LSVDELRLDPSGEFHAGVTLPHPDEGGAFTARARWWGDAHHVRGASPRIGLVVDPP